MSALYSRESPLPSGSSQPKRHTPEAIAHNQKANTFCLGPALLLSALWIFCLLTLQPVHAADTAFIGIPTSEEQSRGCAVGQAISGIEIKHETSGSEAITQLRVRCTAIASDGSWLNGIASFSSWTSSDRPDAGYPSVTTSAATCGENRWVSAIGGWTTQVWFNTVMRRLQVTCSTSEAFGQVLGSTETEAAGATQGAGAGSVSCPGSVIASDVVVRRGWYVDAVALDCDSPVPAAPVMHYPIAGDTSATGNWAVTMLHITGATLYEVCLLPQSTDACFAEVSIGVNDVHVSTPQPDSPTGIVYFPIDIPANRAAEIIRWKTRACGAAACTAWSPTEATPVVPNPPLPQLPVADYAAATRTVTFSWQPEAFAIHGYQLFVFDQYAHWTEKYRVGHPTAVPNPDKMVNVSLATGTTSHTLTLPDAMGSDLRWAVTSCIDTSSPGATDLVRRCSLGYSARPLTVPAPQGASFAALFNQSNFRNLEGQLTYQNPRCITCHGVFTENSTLPSGHATIGPGSRNNNCTQCHEMPGSLPWSAPAAALDFRGKSSQELCNMTKQHSDVVHHLKDDPLIHWSFTSLPPTTSEAPDFNAEWNARVDQWVAAGMACD